MAFPIMPMMSILPTGYLYAGYSPSTGYMPVQQSQLLSPWSLTDPYISFQAAARQPYNPWSAYDRATYHRPRSLSLQDLFANQLTRSVPDTFSRLSSPDTFGRLSSLHRASGLNAALEKLATTLNKPAWRDDGENVVSVVHGLQGSEVTAEMEDGHLTVRSRLESADGTVRSSTTTLRMPFEVEDAEQVSLTYDEARGTLAVSIPKPPPVEEEEPKSAATPLAIKKAEPPPVEASPVPTPSPEEQEDELDKKFAMVAEASAAAAATEPDSTDDALANSTEAAEAEPVAA